MLGGISVIAAAGCRAPATTWMPLREGAKWTYDVHNVRIKTVATLQVTGPTAVGGAAGFVLGGDLGTSKMAWRGSTLVASELCGTRFDPPLPLLNAEIPANPLGWTGTLQTPLESIDASATVRHEQVKVTYANQPTRAVQTTVALHAGTKVMTLVTVFVNGVGIVRQDQRTNQLQDVSISLLTGP